MKAVVRVDLLKVLLLFTYLFFILSAFAAWAQGKKHNEKGCGDTSFTTDIVKFLQNESCYDVVLNVSFKEGVIFELSHANFDFGCGTYSNAENSEGWAMELNNVDPTTGLAGIKVDDIQNFGKDQNLKEFQVKFRYCPDQECDFSDLDIAYKAGQCIYRENLSNDINSDNDGSDGDEGDGSGNDSTDGDNNNDDSNDNCNNDGSVDPPADLVVSAEKINPTCLKENSGFINLSVKGGLAPIKILWNTGEMTSALSSIPAGTYSYTVTDALGNQSTGDVILKNTTEILIESIITKPDCQNINNGSVELLVSGGTAPYSFLWDNGSTNQNLLELYANTYQVTVTDANGCSSTMYIPLFSETNIRVEANIVQPSCQDKDRPTGSISLAPTGGSEPYTYLWSDGQTNSFLEGIDDGKYNVVISDQNGCTYSASFSIVTDVGIDASSTVTKTNCLDENIGAIDLTVSGDSGPYNIIWSNGTESEDIDGLTSGDYIATITDNNGCQTTYSTSVLKDDITIGYDEITIPSCSGNSDGIININVSNATDPYTINWTNIETGATISSEEEITNLSSGHYAVSIVDDAGCTADQSIQLPEPPPIEIAYETTVDDCTGSQVVILEVSGGSWEYSYLWSDGSTNDQLNDVAPGSYSVTVTDSRQCMAEIDVVVEDIQNQNLACLIEDPANDISCGTTNNTLTSTVSNAISYSWFVSSSDGGWEITSAKDQSQIEFTAGTTGSQATVTLTVAIDGGCELSCEKLISSCLENQNPDDGSTCDNSNEGDGTDEETDDAMNDNGNSNDGSSEEDGTDDAINDCSVCEGGVTYLNLDYLGDGPVSITVTGEIKGRKGRNEKKEWEQIFNAVNNGDLLEIQTPEGADKLGTRTYLTIGGGEPFEIHTSCSQNIEVGMVFGNYKVIDGASLKGGPFCEAIASDDIIADNGNNNDGSNEEDGADCNECEGGVTYLNLDYLGDGPVSITVTGEIKGKKGKNEKKEWEQIFNAVNNGDLLEIQTPEGAEKLGTRTYLTIGGGEPFEIHTSCSQNIEVGMVFGNYKVVDGASLKGGPFCETIASGDGGTEDDDTGEHEADNDIADEEDSTGEGEPFADKACDRFYSDPVLITKTSTGYQYSIDVNYNDCRYDLSHLTIDIPDCYQIEDFSNSMNWAMDIVNQDPTTGLSGLKIDDIPSFGKDEQLTSFSISFTLTSDNSDCLEELQCFTPTIAYKASTCVYKETTKGECAEENDLAEVITTYPNPTTDVVKVDMKNCDNKLSYKADVFDYRGDKIRTYLIEKGFTDELVIDMKYRKHGLYILQLTRSDGKHSRHKIIKL